MTTDRNDLDRALDSVAAGRLIPYLGPGVLTLRPPPVPTSPEALAAAIEARIRVPKRVGGNLWRVAQYIETHRYRATVGALMVEAFAPGAPGNPVHHWLARVRPPLVVDVWYDDALIQAFVPPSTSRSAEPWGWVQGWSRHGIGVELWHRSFDGKGGECEGGPDPSWRTLIYKPHGLARDPGHMPGYGGAALPSGAPSGGPVPTTPLPRAARQAAQTRGSSFLVSDSDYVEVLTEIDIQTPIPDEVQRRRQERGFLFLGCRFDDQLLRTFARQIMKRTAGPHYAVLQNPLTRMEAWFLKEQGIRQLDLDLPAVESALAVPC